MLKKICFFTTHFDFPRQRYLNYYEKIIPKNVACYLFCRKDAKSKFKTKRIKKIVCDSTKFLIPFKLKRFCIENNIEAIINLSGSADVAINLTLATIFTKTKNIFYFHGNPNFRKKDFIFFFTQFFTDRFLVSAKDIAERAKKNLFFSKNKIFYLPLTVDTKLYKPRNKTQSRRKLNLLENEKIIVFVGRISYLKGSDLMLELIKRNPEKRFIMIGELMDENFREKQFRNLLLIPSANAQELVDYYNASDLCILLSRTEGFGLVPREAMACGIPAMVSDIESLRMIEPAIKTALDAEKVQEAINNFFKLSENERKTLRKKSRLFILDECSEENSNLKKRHLDCFLNF